MKAKDILAIGTVALGTATLTVLALWSPGLEAGAEDNVLAAKIAKPKLIADGVEMTLTAAGGQNFTMGEEPVYDLTAINTTGEPVTTTIQLSMTASSPRDINSRVARLPALLCRQEETLRLTANESKTIHLATRTKLPANSMIFVSLQRAESPAKALLAGSLVSSLMQTAHANMSGIVAMSFSTVTNAARTIVDGALPVKVALTRNGA